MGEVGGLSVSFSRRGRWEEEDEDEEEVGSMMWV
jgi:hypothetical protein